MAEKKTNLFGWFKKKEVTFTADEVKDLLDRVNGFNCGAIDAYLGKHVDKVFVAWLKDMKAAKGAK